MSSIRKNPYAKKNNKGGPPPVPNPYRKKGGTNVKGGQTSAIQPSTRGASSRLSSTNSVPVRNQNSKELSPSDFPRPFTLPLDPMPHFQNQHDLIAQNLSTAIQNASDLQDLLDTNGSMDRKRVISDVGALCNQVISFCHLMVLVKEVCDPINKTYNPSQKCWLLLRAIRSHSQLDCGEIYSRMDFVKPGILRKETNTPVTGISIDDIMKSSTTRKKKYFGATVKKWWSSTKKNLTILAPIERLLESAKEDILNRMRMLGVQSVMTLESGCDDPVQELIPTTPLISTAQWTSILQLVYQSRDSSTTLKGDVQRICRIRSSTQKPTEKKPSRGIGTAAMKQASSKSTTKSSVRDSKQSSKVSTKDSDAKRAKKTSPKDRVSDPGNNTEERQNSDDSNVFDTNKYFTLSENHFETYHPRWAREKPECKATFTSVLNDVTAMEKRGAGLKDILKGFGENAPEFDRSKYLLFLRHLKCCHPAHMGFDSDPKSNRASFCILADENKPLLRYLNLDFGSCSCNDALNPDEFVEHLRTAHGSIDGGFFVDFVMEYLRFCYSDWKGTGMSCFMCICLFREIFDISELDFLS